MESKTTGQSSSLDGAPSDPHHVPSRCTARFFNEEGDVVRTATIVDFSLKSPTPRHEDLWIKIHASGGLSFGPTPGHAELGRVAPFRVGLVPIGNVILHDCLGRQIVRLGGVPDDDLDVGKVV